MESRRRRYRVPRWAVPPSFKHWGRRFLFCDRKQQILDLGLRPYLQKTLLVLDSFLSLTSGGGFPSVRTLAHRRGCSVRTIQNHLKELEVETKLISRTQRFRKNGRQSSNWFTCRYLDLPSARAAARHLSPQSCTPRILTPKDPTERKLLPQRDEYSHHRGPTKIQLALQYLEESQTFRRRMVKVWELVEDFIASPRDSRNDMAMDYVKHAYGNVAYRTACVRLKLKWEKRRGFKVGKASGARKGKSSTYARREVHTPWGDVTERTGGWSSASVSSSASLGLRDY